MDIRHKNYLVFFKKRFGFVMNAISIRNKNYLLKKKRVRF